MPVFMALNFYFIYIYLFSKRASYCVIFYTALILFLWTGIGLSKQRIKKNAYLLQFCDWPDTELRLLLFPLFALKDLPTDDCKTNWYYNRISEERRNNTRNSERVYER